MEHKLFNDLLEYRDWIAKSGKFELDQLPQPGKEGGLNSSILLLLQSPEKANAGLSREMSINNDIPILKNVKSQLSRLRIPESQLVVWNLIGVYGVSRVTKQIESDWLQRLAPLVNQMNNLKVIIGCGSYVWRALYKMEYKKLVYTVPVSESVDRKAFNNRDKESFERTWNNIKQILDSQSPVGRKGIVSETQGKLRDTIDSLGIDSLKNVAAGVKKSNFLQQLSKAKDEIQNIWLDTWIIDKKKRKRK